MKTIQELEIEIKKHQNLYYNGNPEISDAEFDVLWDTLKEIDPQNAVFFTINSEFTDGFPKEYHVIPMGSQDKAANPEEFTAWAHKKDFDDFIVQYKLDGASLELQYENGSFTKAVTRGDGKIGDDISANASKMKGLVFTLPGEFGPDGVQAFSGGVRCEVIMPKDIHASYYSDKANCRNAANGLMKRKDGSGSEHLSLICYDATSARLGNPFTRDTPFTTEIEKLQWLQDCGFEVVPYTLCKGVASVIEYRTRVMETRSQLNYDIDGLVIKSHIIDTVDLARSRPEKQIAFKFSLEEAVSTILAVEWSESGTTYTPVAIVEPVQLAGTQVQRASLANPNMIENLNLKIGSKVVLTKRGEIIPKIESLVKNPEHASEIEYPSICSSCQSALLNEGTRLKCPNPKCPKIAHHRIEKWISVLDIRDFGENLIRRLFDSGRIKNIPDIYTLTIEELAGLERMGEKSATKVYRALHSHVSISLQKFIAGFDIEGIGETMVDKLVEAGFDTLEKLYTASEQDFAGVYQFGFILAKTLKDGLEILHPEMDSLLAMNIVSIKEQSKNGVLIGKSFCFTGELQTMKRNEAENLVVSLGGTVKSSVVKGLSYLVTNTPESGSSKNKKAVSLSIPIINEQEFFSLTEGSIENKAPEKLISRVAEAHKDFSSIDLGASPSRSQIELDL